MLDLSALNDEEREVLLVPVAEMTEEQKTLFNGAIKKVPMRTRWEMARLSVKDLHRECRAARRAIYAKRHPFAPAMHTLGKIAGAIIIAGGVRATLKETDSTFAKQAKGAYR